MLSSGTHLGSYEVLALIGKGGMGEVWKARDTKLDRDVTLKILPAAFASDPDRMARFEREARVLASLDHPNIAAIYGLEDSDGVRALVLALIDGPTLAERIAAGPIPLDEAVQIARQIAEAVEYAHERGVIHRDLKPANIKITSGGTVRVLDFGLAKALDDEPTAASTTNSPTVTMNATRAGVLLGTAQYMSPEQARGKQADRRSDVWSFGAVLYEMVTGKPPFSGETVGDILASVIKDEPKLDVVRAEVRSLIGRCLNKDPRQRLQAIGEARIALEHSSAAKAQPTGTPKTLALPWMVAAGVLALIAAGLGLGWWRATRTVEQPLKPLVRLDVDLGPDVSLTSPAGSDVIISPDGSRLAYLSKNKLYTRRLDQPKATELAETAGAFEPFFSPDGRWIAFFSGGKLKKISVEGGGPVELCVAPNPFGGSWGEDGDIIAALTPSGLSRVPSAGGPSTPVTHVAQGESGHVWPQILPGGKAVLFTTGNGGGEYNIQLVSLANQQRKTLQRGGAYGRYVPTGHLLYISQGNLFAVPFGLSDLEVHGVPIPVVDGFGYSAPFGSAHLDFSQNGILVYRGGAATGLETVQWLDATGKMQPLLAKPGLYGRPHLSPDGRRLALEVNGDAWTYDWERDILTRLTFNGGLQPIWTPDGRYILFQKQGISLIRSDGAGKARVLTQSKLQQWAYNFTPDGRRLAFFEGSLGAGVLYTLPFENDGAGLRPGKPEVFAQSQFDQRNPAFSPDGRWIAYASDGTVQVYIRAFPDAGGKWQVSSEGGTYPAWSRNGREIFFETLDNRIMVAKYTAKGDSFHAEKPRLWSDKSLGGQANFLRNYDLAPDGKRIAALMPAEGSDTQHALNHVIFLENFFDELRRRVPVAK